MCDNEIRKQAIISDLQTQWQDHFHMRDQTWKVLNYSIGFFVGLVGLVIKKPDKVLLIPLCAAVIITSLFGAFIAIHHRKRQIEKFQIIGIYERELGLDELIQPVLDKSHKTLPGRINTSSYIAVMQCGLFAASVAMLVKILAH